MENKTNKCALWFFTLLVLLITHSYSFYLGTQNTLTFKIESREGELSVDNQPMPIEKTSELDNIVDSLEPIVIKD
jgi:hypothetical protein